MSRKTARSVRIVNPSVSHSTSPPPEPVERVPLSVAERRRHLDWALQLTSVPTATGREQRVIRWVKAWLKPRRNVAVKRDRFGNLLLSVRGREKKGGPTVLFTGHLDHPAFNVVEVLDERHVRLEFRGGVRAEYFPGAAVAIHDARGGVRRARIVEFNAKGRRFNEVVVRLAKSTNAVAVDDLATWDLPPAAVRGGLLHAPACDDLAGVAAALCAFDVLRGRRDGGDARVLLTRAEEVGFVGAILASESGLIPRHAKVLALENSRSFAESPIGGGPIVRVGDRVSVFHHGLTYQVSKIAERLAASDSAFRWQRKLMPGGTCEATTFLTYGYEATCLCLALGNYHNMADLEAVSAGTNARPARIDREYVSVEDYHGLIDLLIACGRVMAPAKKTAREDRALDGATALLDMMHGIRDRRRFVLEEPAARV